MSKRKRDKRWKTGRLHWPGSHHDGHEHDHDGEAARLTPLEETDAFEDSPQRDGKENADDTIRVDSSVVPMPEHLMDDDEREGASIFRLEPVVVFILVTMLLFIAFIAWQITLMPVRGE